MSLNVVSAVTLTAMGLHGRDSVTRPNASWPPYHPDFGSYVGLPTPLWRTDSWPVAELDVKKRRKDVTEWRCCDAVKTVEYNDWRQFIISVSISIVIIIGSTLWDAAVSDSGEILSQFSSRLTVNVEHGCWVVAEALTWPDTMNEPPEINVQAA